MSKHRLRVRLEFDFEEDPTDYDFDQHPETPQQFAAEMLREFTDDESMLRDYIEDARYASDPFKLRLTVEPVPELPKLLITTRDGTVFTYDRQNKIVTWADRTYTEVHVPFAPVIGRSFVYQGRDGRLGVITTRQSSDIVIRIEDA